MKPFCQNCDDTGKCPCGASDCRHHCESCYCDSCSESGKYIVRIDEKRKTECLECVKTSAENK